MNRLEHKTVLFLGILAIMAPVLNARAQAKLTHEEFLMQELGCSTGMHEILLTIHDIAVQLSLTVTNLETGEQPIIEKIISPDDNLRQDCDWLVENGDSGTSGENADTLIANTLWEMQFEVVGNSSEVYTYTYFQCDPGFQNKDGFYCTNGDEVENDMYLIYEGGTMKVYIEALASTEGAINDRLGDSGWLVPQHLDVFCDSSENPITCNQTADQISYFITPQSGSAFNVTVADLTVPTNKSWNFVDVELNFAPSIQLIVQGTLAADHVTFNGNPILKAEAGSSTTLTATTLTLAADTSFIRDAFTLAGGDTLSGGLLSLETSAVTLAGSNTLLGTEVNVAEGDTLRVPPGATLTLGCRTFNATGDDCPDPSVIQAYGVLHVQGAIRCQARGEVVGIGLGPTDPVQHILLDGGTIDTNGTRACIIARDGRVAFGAGMVQAVSDGAFLASEGGVYELGDGAQVVYQATADTRSVTRVR